MCEVVQSSSDSKLMSSIDVIFVITDYIGFCDNARIGLLQKMEDKFQQNKIRDMWAGMRQIKGFSTKDCQKQELAWEKPKAA